MKKYTLYIEDEKYKDLRNTWMYYNMEFDVDLSFQQFMLMLLDKNILYMKETI